jgi:hypothetical protein
MRALVADIHVLLADKPEEESRGGRDKLGHHGALFAFPLKHILSFNF